MAFETNTQFLSCWVLNSDVSQITENNRGGSIDNVKYVLSLLVLNSPSTLMKGPSPTEWTN